MGDTPTDASATDANVTPPSNPAPNLDPTPPTPPATDEDALGDAGKKALDAERKARRDVEAKLKELEPLAEEARKRAEADKSEATKSAEALASERDARGKAEVELLRYKVGAAKGVPSNLVQFLTGSTKEEVEQAADTLLAELGTNKPSMPGRPTERLANGQPSNTNKLDKQSPEELIKMGRGIDFK
jgi:hypothetical protein